jgi:hypothetical protein
MIILGYFATILMGVTLGLLGGGGSILIVPILVYLFRVDPIAATTSSLFIVGATALMGSIQYIKRQEVSFKSGIQFASASFIGIYFSRSILVPNLPHFIISTEKFQISSSDLILISFAVLMLLASIAMLKRKGASEIEVKPAPGYKTALQGIAVGIATGFVGAGGGFLILPALVNLVGLRMRIAVGTSLLIIAANSLFGFGVSLMRNNQIDWTLQLTLLLLALVGSFIGARLSNRISEQALKKGFGLFVLIIGSLIIIERLVLR